MAIINIKLRHKDSAQKYGGFRLGVLRQTPCMRSNSSQDRGGGGGGAGTLSCFRMGCLSCHFHASACVSVHGRYVVDASGSYTLAHCGDNSDCGAGGVCGMDGRCTCNFAVCGALCDSPANTAGSCNQMSGVRLAVPTHQHNQCSGNVPRQRPCPVTIPRPSLLLPPCPPPPPICVVNHSAAVP
jgi:hypothetical protein